MGQTESFCWILLESNHGVACGILEKTKSSSFPSIIALLGTLKLNACVPSDTSSLQPKMSSLIPPSLPLFRNSKAFLYENHNCQKRTSKALPSLYGQNPSSTTGFFFNHCNTPCRIAKWQKPKPLFPLPLMIEPREFRSFSSSNPPSGTSSLPTCG